MNRKNTAATERIIEAVHGSYKHGMRTVIRLATVTLWWEEKWLEANVLRAFVYVFLILVMKIS
jgi:hypothetical protein